MGGLEPDEAADLISDSVGDVMRRVALGESVDGLELREAVGASLILGAETSDEVFNPRNRYVVELFCSP